MQFNTPWLIKFILKKTFKIEREKNILQYTYAKKKCYAQAYF